MAGIPAANILIGGLLCLPLRVADLGSHHARDALEHQLRAPEATGSKGGLLQVGRLRNTTVILNHKMLS